MAYNKFITKAGKVMLDLTQDDITPQDVRQGRKFHGRDGVSYTGELGLELQSETVTPTKDTQEISAKSNYYGLSKVTVNPIPEDYIIPENTKNITDNGVYDVKTYASVEVSVQPSLQGINGVVEQYKVAAGASVNAGDFVEFVSSYGRHNITDVKIDYIKADKLDNNKILVVYNDTTNSYHGMATVLTITDTNEVIVSSTVEFNNSDTTNISLAILSETRAIVSYDSSRYIYAKVLCIDDTEITFGDAYKLDNTAGSSNQDIVALSDTEALVSQKASSSGYISVLYLKINDKIITSHGSTDNNSQYYSKLAKVSDDTAICVAYKNSMLKYNAALISVSGQTLSIINSCYAENAGEDIISIVVMPSKDRFVIIYTHSTSNTTYAELFAIENNVISHKYTLSNLAEGSALSNISVKVLDDKTIIAVGKAKSKGISYLLNVENDVITKSTSTVFETNAPSTTSVITLSPTNAFVVYDNGIGRFTSLKLSDGVIMEDSTVQYTSVRPATSSLYKLGVAKTSGTEGQSIEVYTVK